MDQSELDNKYFIDEHVYNCPFCNRNHVKYYVTLKAVFDWTREKKCHLYLTKCQSCGGEAMHLTFMLIPLRGQIANSRSFLLTRTIYDENDVESVESTIEEKELDDVFFYSVPTSFFTLDKRIPKIVRELLIEAEGCLKSNYLTGASACARKLIYEMAVIEKAEGENYDDRLKSLKSVRPDVDETYFDTLLTIQQVTSSKVHERSSDAWEPKHLRVILSTIREILNEMYVIPAIKLDKRKAILNLKEEVIGKSSKTQEGKNRI